MHIIDTHCHIGLHKYEPVETLLLKCLANRIILNFGPG